MSPALRIAIADDEVDMREYFQKILTRLGHEVVSVAQDGRELIEQCRKHKPDLIITDIKMPLVDGVDAVSELSRELSAGFVLMSASPDTRPMTAAEREQILGFLIKPIKKADLERILALALARCEQKGGDGLVSSLP